MGQTEVEYKTRPQNEFVRIWIYGCNEIKQLSILKRLWIIQVLRISSNKQSDMDIIVHTKMHLFYLKWSNKRFKFLN